MEQLRQASRYVWKHHFWFSLGLVAILAGTTQPTGTQRLAYYAKQKQDELNQIFTDQSIYASGMHANQDWSTVADDEKRKLDQKVNEIWEQLYQEQQELMTWPEVLNEELEQAVEEGLIPSVFQGRPFGSNLSDQRDRFLFLYDTSYVDYAYEIYQELDPIRLDEDGKVVGTVDSKIDVLRIPQTEERPSSEEAWLIQEQFWIQRAICKAIADANREAIEIAKRDAGPDERSVTTSGWWDAVVRKLLVIQIGEPGLDHETRALLAEREGFGEGLLVDIFRDPKAEDQEENLFGGFQGASGVENEMIVRERYLERDHPQYRMIPVFVSMLVDQSRIPLVLASFSAADFGFSVRQIGVGVPRQPVRVPELLRSAGIGGRSEVLYDTFQLNVWGLIHFYGLPPSMQDETEAPAKPEDADDFMDEFMDDEFMDDDLGAETEFD